MKSSQEYELVNSYKTEGPPGLHSAVLIVWFIRTDAFFLYFARTSYDRKRRENISKVSSNSLFPRLLILLSPVTHAPFMRQCWGLQVGPMHETAGIGKLINPALLSLLMRRVWIYAVLPSSSVNSSVPLVCRHDRVSR